MAGAPALGELGDDQQTAAASASPNVRNAAEMAAVEIPPRLWRTLRTEGLLPWDARLPTS